jgi:hypothetical protein
MFLESLVLSSMRLGVPFIAPRQLGAVGGQLGRPILPSVEWCTGQSGAPPDSHCSSLVRDLLPYWRIRLLVLGIGWRTRHYPVHTGQSDVPNRPLARATCHAMIARPTVGRERLCLTGQSGAPPDSLVNYSRMPLSFSREQPVHRRPPWRNGHCPMHHWTVRCAWPELVLAELCQLFSNLNHLFLVLFLALR